MPRHGVSVTLAELWQLALPKGTKLVAGDAGLDHSVTWVASLGSAVPLFGTIEPGYLAFADPEMARRIDPRITFDYLARQLARAGVAGLVLSEMPADSEIELVDALSLPTLVLPPGADLAACERDVLRTLIDREGRIARRELQARETLQAAFRGGDLCALATKLAVLAGAEVAIHDARGQSVAHVSPADAREEGEPASSASITVPIRLAGRTLGELTLAHPRVGETLAKIYARQAAELCAAELLQRDVRRETEERLGAELVEELLDPSSGDDHIISRLSRQGYTSSAAHAQAAVALTALLPLTHDDGGPPGKVLQVATSLQRAAERDGARVLLSAYHHAAICFVASEGLPLGERLRYWLSLALPASSEQAACHAGVSRIVAGDLAGLRDAVRQALDALQLGYRVGSPQSPYHYGELGLYRLLAAFHGQAEVTRFVDETIGPLLRYDREHDAELVRTLEAYLQEHGNSTRAAEALYVHRNTLAYRLKRLAEILSVDLDDPETRLALHLALKLYALRPD